MKNKTLIPSLLFLLVSLAHILGLVYHEFLAFVTKPMIIATLIVLYSVSMKQFNIVYLLGLIFSLAGDVILEFDDSLFTFGLGAFLLAHIFYILVSYKFLPKVSSTKILMHSIPFVLIFAGLLYTIYPNLGALLIPVVIYGIVISVFGVVTFLVYTNNKQTENLWLFLGATTFIVSDSILALNKFYEPSEFLSISIMITYIIAQYLICKAMIVKSK